MIIWHSLPSEIVKIILDMTSDLQNYNCHTCGVKIKCFNNRLTCGKWAYCCNECYLFF